LRDTEHLIRPAGPKMRHDEPADIIKDVLVGPTIMHGADMLTCLTLLLDLLCMRSVAQVCLHNRKMYWTYIAYGLTVGLLT
jgi:hypothetical protein